MLWQRTLETEHVLRLDFKICFLILIKKVLFFSVLRPISLKLYSLLVYVIVQATPQKEFQKHVTDTELYCHQHLYFDLLEAKIPYIYIVDV